MKISLTTLFIGLTLHISAQQKLSGLITTSEKEPLFGVQVTIDELHSGTTTDENGFYEMVNLPNTTLKITVSYIGFESQSKAIALHQNETTINFMLKESIFKLDEINLPIFHWCPPGDHYISYIYLFKLSRIRSCRMSPVEHV